MFKTLKNSWRIPELRSKLLFTMLIIVLYRLGANIPVPYVDPAQTFAQASEIFVCLPAAREIKSRTVIPLNRTGCWNA